MSSTRRAAMIALLVVLAGIGTGRAQTDAVTPTAANRVEQRSIELAGRRILVLSPDGKFLAASKPVVGGNPTQLCVVDVATLAERSCGDLSKLESGLRLEDVVWSPDGTRLAFAENTFQVFRDGDLWVMDAATGVVTDVTDDGFSGKLPILNQPPRAAAVYLDVAPAWSPDGTSLAFSRTILRAGAFQGNEITRVDLLTGTPRTILTVSAQEPGVVYPKLLWTPDGKQLVYSLNHSESRNPENGTWVVDADGTNPHQLLTSDPTLGPPVVEEISPRGDKALAYYIMAAEQVTAHGPIFGLVDMAAGSVTPLKLLATDAPSDAFVAMATFSPDGSRLLYTSRNTNPDNQVLLRAVAGTQETRLIDGLPRAAMTVRGRGPTWSPDGTVFVPGEISTGTLLRLGAIAATPPSAAPGTIRPGITVIVNDDHVALRSAPSAKATIAARLPRGTTLTVIGPAETAEGFTWWPVKEPATKTIGYVREEFLSVPKP